MSGTLLRGLVLASIAGAMVFAWQAGLYEGFSAEQLRDEILGTGAWGAALFVPIFVLGGVLHLPAMAFPLAAGLIWPLPLALLVSWLGATASALLLFAIARFTLRQGVEQRLPERLRELDAQLAKRGFRTVILCRLITFVGPAFQWLLGATRVEARDVVLATPIGILPWVTALVMLGSFDLSWATRSLALTLMMCVSWFFLARGALALRATPAIAGASAVGAVDEPS